MLDINATPAPAFLVAVAGDEFRFVALNETCLRAMGGGGQIGKTPHEHFPGPLADTLVANYRACVRSRGPVSYELESVLPSGYTCWQTTLVPIAAPETGEIVTLFGVCVDVTAERIAERARNAFHESLSLAVGAIDGGFWTYDIPTGRFEASRPLTELLAGPDQPPLDLVGYLNFIYAEDLSTFPTFAQDSTADFRVMTYDRRTRWLHSKRRVVRDAHGNPASVVALVLDVTDQTIRQQALEVEASTDDLTGAKNRRGLERIAAALLAYPFEADNPVALIMLDLDAFKPVNDAFGHQVGNDLLRDIARRIMRLVRHGQTVARIGGDEFAILVRRDSAARLIERVERALARPFRHGPVTIGLSASVGTTVQTPEDRTLTDMIGRADQALYSAKRERKPLTA